MLRIFALFVSLVGACAAQVDLHVDPLALPGGSGSAASPLQSLQAAIALAGPGDRVLAAPGTYVENIDFLGKGIAVESTTGAATTIIHGVGGSVVRFQSGEAPASVLEGFTVTNGTGTATLGALHLQGGGIRIVNASPTIRRCVIEGNQLAATGLETASGGGIAVIGGGGLLEDCTVRNNVIGPAASGASGGGIWVLGASLTLRRCEVSANTVVGTGRGGGVVHDGSFVFFDACRIVGNAVGGTGQAGRGGGCYAGSGGLSAFLRCTITDNAASGPAGGADPVLATGGGGLMMQFHDTALVGCLIVGNTTGGRGGGLHALSSNGAISRCTLTDNAAVTSGSGAFIGHATIPAVPPAAPAIASSIIWGNVADDLATDFGLSPIALAVDYSDVGAGAGSFGGTGNFDADPEFFAPASGDYRLSVGSPCRDAGATGLPNPLDFDVEGDPATVSPDVGFDEFRGLEACGAGNVGAGSGGPYDVLFAGGSAGGPGRLVRVPVGTTFSIDVVQPPTRPDPAHFVIIGHIGLPDPAFESPIGGGVGSLCFPSPAQIPGFPGVFFFTSSLGPLPGSLVASTPSPWTISGPALPFPFELAFHGVILETATDVAVLNGIALRFE